MILFALLAFLPSPYGFAAKLDKAMPAFSHFERLAEQSEKEGKSCSEFLAAGKDIPTDNVGTEKIHRSKEDALRTLAWLQKRPPLPKASQEARELYLKEFTEIRKEATSERISAAMSRISGECGIFEWRKHTGALLQDLKKFPFSASEKKQIYSLIKKPLLENLPFLSLLSALAAGANLEDYARAKMSPAEFAKLSADFEEYNSDGEGYRLLISRKHKELDGQREGLGTDARYFEAQKVESLTRKYRRLLKKARI